MVPALKGDKIQHQAGRREVLFVDGARSGRASTYMKGDKIQNQAGRREVLFVYGARSEG